MKRIVSLILVAVLLLGFPYRTLALFGVGDTSDGFLASILSENMKQTVDGLQQLQQLREVLQTTRENYEFVRSTYAVAESIQNFDADRFLTEARSDFMQANPVFTDANSLANDITHQGLRGGQINWWAIQHQIDIFHEDQQARQCGCDADGSPGNPTDIKCVFTCQAAHARGYPFSNQAREIPPSTEPSPYTYDEKAAARLAGALDNIANDEVTRQQLLDSPPSPNSADAVVFSEIATRDQSAADALLRKRAVASKAGASAHKNTTDAYGANLNAGTAAVLTARSSSIGAEQLAAINEGQANLVSMEQAKMSQQTKDRQADQQAMQIHALHMADLLFLVIHGDDSGPSAPSSGVWE